MRPEFGRYFGCYPSGHGVMGQPDTEYPLVYPWARRDGPATYCVVQQDLCMFFPLPPNNASPTSQPLWDRRLRGQNDESGKSPHHETSL